MSIIKVKPDTVIEVGKYVCFVTMMTNALCGLPRRVTRIAGQRIYVMDKHDEVEEYHARKSAVFMCDTKEEGIAAQKISHHFLNELLIRTTVLNVQIEKERDDAINDLILKSEQA